MLFTQADGATWSLAAVPFDAGSASITGKVDILASDIGVHCAAPIGVTVAGDLFCVSGAARSARRVVTIDATGSEREVALPPGAWTSLRLAPDGRQLALTRWDSGRRSIWALTPGAQPTSLLATPCLGAGRTPLARWPMARVFN